MLTLHDLACAKGERILFRHVQATVARGTWLHVTGANGAGKTSLLRILCGLTVPAAGEVRWDGSAIGELGDAYRRELLYIGHDSGLQGLLTTRENLQVATLLGGASPAGDAVAAALDRLGLVGKHELPTRFLSQGQKRRVALARLALSQATLWVLDEPFVAMDVQALAVLNELIAAHLDRGGIAVLTSHQPVELGGRTGQTLEVTR